MFENALGLVRPRQWAKSLLVLIPFILTSISAYDLLVAIVAFLSFALASSVGYVINDVVDAQSDRLHPEKKRRPIASKAVSPAQALIFAGLLFLASGVAAITVGKLFAATVMLYLALSISYSFYLKKVQVLDVVLLSLFYILRIVGGGIAIGVEASQWLLTFAFLSFLSLGFAKRSIELQLPLRPGMKVGEEDGDLKGKLPGRGYKNIDSAWSFISGISSGVVSVLVLALYLDLGRDDNNLLAVALVPIWTYWILRIWLKVGRNELDHDPIAFAIRDKVTLIIGVLMFVLLVFGENLNFLFEFWMGLR